MRVAQVPVTLAVLAAVVLAAGCGGDGGGESTETNAATTSTTTTIPAGRPTTLAATLTASAAVPKGPAGAAGTASITLNPRKGTACWTLTVSGIVKPLSAHIHDGRPAANAVVVIPLGDRFSRKGCVLTGRRALNEVARAPGSYYVDVHTQKHLQGAVRGKLRAASA